MRYTADSLWFAVKVHSTINSLKIRDTDGFEQACLTICSLGLETELRETWVQYNTCVSLGDHIVPTTNDLNATFKTNHVVELSLQPL